ncbi:sensor histidine kinase [uncultured Proteiniphilum sp.]|uniref:sensor histidine kinase n=1 Tax=uncultured Proteiniphilum sp. TaxID=497637 RepID=UPI002610B294|nr:sensor histidine kinase [uncultured Proteiniphilum sp.]
MHKKKLINILFHLLIWTVILVIITLMPLRPDHTVSLTRNLPFIITYLYLVCFFYINANYLIVKLILNKKYLLYILGTGMILLLYIYFHHYIFSLFFQLDFSQTAEMPLRRGPSFEGSPFGGPPHFGGPHFMRENRMVIPFRRIILPLTQFLLFWLLSACYKLIYEWMSLHKKNKEIEAEKSLIELAYLKAQINPHFILNTLNTIYSLTLKGSEKAPDAILLYSQVIRYIFDKIDTDFVPLQEEIDYINDYIDLQVLRFTDTLNIEFKIEGNMEGHWIVPLIFISFIENSFQYGISNHYRSTISISIKADGNNIYFSTENRKYKKNDFQHMGKNIGIKNTKRKLSLIYPDKHKLSIKETNEFFYIDLIIFGTSGK